MIIALGCDHIVTDEKTYLHDRLEEAGYEVLDLGTYSHTRTHYPIYGKAVGEAVASGRADLGVVLCGTGIGMAVAADKVPGVRASSITSPAFAELFRQHNNGNVVCLSGRFVDLEVNKQIVKTFLTTEFEGGRHERRVEKIMALDTEEA